VSTTDTESVAALQARRDAALVTALRAVAEVLELHLQLQVRKLAEAITR